MCEFYGVSRSGYYTWRRRKPSARSLLDKELSKRIAVIHKESRGTYGSPRVHRALRKEGIYIGRKRVIRLMRTQGLKGRSARLYWKKAKLHKYFTGIPNHSRKVEVNKPNQVWVGDITYLRVAGRWRYLAVVMDKFSRRIIGWKLGRHKNSELTMAAFSLAVTVRKPKRGLVFHSDRGSEFGAWDFRGKLDDIGCIQSMNRPSAKMIDNAHMESFFHSMKSDGVHGTTFKNGRSLAGFVRGYIPFYNNRRLHSSLDYMTPVEFEGKIQKLVRVY